MRRLKPVLVATHPRSGTHLTIDLLRKQFVECQSWLWFGETLHHLYLDLDHLARDCSPCKSIEKAKCLLRRADRPIVKTHSLPSLDRFRGARRDFAEMVINAADIIYVVRDGRDVMCSAHVWMKEYHPETRCSLSAFIRQKEHGISRVKQWKNHMRAWMNQDSVHLIRFEDILSRPRAEIERLADALGLDPQLEQPYLPRKITGSGRWSAYWRRLTRQFESTAIFGAFQ